MEDVVYNPGELITKQNNLEVPSIYILTEGVIELFIEINNKSQ